MAKFDYEDMRQTALELIEEFGQTMTIEKPDGSQRQTFTGVLLDLSYSDKQNTLLVEATGKVYVAQDLKRETSDDGDRVTINKVRYAVISAETINPAGIEVLTTLYLRR